MHQFTIISKKEISSVLDMDTVIEAVEKAYSLKCDNQAELFPIVCHSFEDGVSEFDIKSGSMDGAGIFGMKLVSAFEGNDKYNLPRLTGTILVFDRETGMLRSMMDGGLITNMRTGAAGGVGCKYLARPESEVLLLVGTGAQGPVLLEATLNVMKNIKKIYVANLRSPHKVEAFINETCEKLGINIPVLPASDLETAVREADIILTATPARDGIIKKEWVKPGTHLSCIGSDMEGKQELDVDLVAAAKLFCDDLTQVINVGECEKAVKQGLVSPGDITEMGDVILGRAQGRRDAEEITIFDSTGIGLQDLMVASQITDMAENQGFGVKMEL
ncbi:MAG: ornithine cyclodeaminase family protein [Firmicutes bacterium]|nr:ornithine cyclodeaminase family protein [Bacillota bacterium]